MTLLKNTKENSTYCNHLFERDIEGYIQIIKISDRKAIKIYNTQYNGLRDVVEGVIGEEDIYISSNTYYKPKRSTSYIRQFRALYIDLDLIKNNLNKNETIYMVYFLAYDKKIPMPSMIVDSGRGIHLYWRIKNAPYGALHTWQELEDYLYNQLKDLGADIKATDGARVLRLPNTINSKNKAECKLIQVNDNVEYSMYDLREQYLNYSQRFNKANVGQTKQVNKRNITRLFNSYTLHLARIRDIEKLCKLRNYDVKGYRNFIIHCYAYWEGIYNRDPEELEKVVFELNNAFKNPLKENEIKAVLRCVPKAIAKFIEYEQGIRSGQRKRVSKGMKDKGGYWYRNETLIEALNITIEEQKYMETIISLEEKYRRNNLKRTPRNEEGLTLKQAELKELKDKVIKLRAEGLSNRAIAKQFNCSEGKIRTLLKR